MKKNSLEQISPSGPAGKNRRIAGTLLLFSTLEMFAFGAKGSIWTMHQLVNLDGRLAGFFASSSITCVCIVCVRRFQEKNSLVNKESGAAGHSTQTKAVIERRALHTNASLKC